MNRKQKISKGIEQDKKYFYPVIEKLFNKHISKFAQFKNATVQQDMEEGFDATLKIPELEIPIRRRDLKYLKRYKFRDVTIRSKLKNGYRTEIDKIRDGAGDYYFYCWGNIVNTGIEIKGNIPSYLIYDINKFRDSGLIENPSVKNKQNIDGITFFNAYKIDDLADIDAIVASDGVEIKNQHPLPF